MDQQVLDLIDIQQMIESRPSTYWQKYVNRINMTFIDCSLLKDDCILPKNQNKFYVYVHHKSEDYRDVDENFSYASSLITPVLKEIGVDVNYSMHLYVGKSGEDSHVEPNWVTEGKIDVVDRVPIIYSHEIEKYGFDCVRPLFISNRLSIISPIIKRERFTTFEIWKVFDIKVWICVFSALNFHQFILNIV